MGTLISSIRPLQNQQDLFTKQELDRRNQAFVLLQNAAEDINNTLADAQFHQGEIHAASGALMCALLGVSAFTSPAIGSAATAIVPKGAEYYMQKGRRNIQILEFKLKHMEQLRDEKRNETPKSQAEQLRQTITTLMQLYAKLYDMR